MVIFQYIGERSFSTYIGRSRGYRGNRYITYNSKFYKRDFNMFIKCDYFST